MKECKCWSCSERIPEDYDYCILHAELPEDEESEEFKKINELKTNKVQEKIKKGNYNFRGVRLYKLILRNLEIHDDFDLMNSRIKKDLRFINCIFRRDICLSSAEISQNVVFYSSQIYRNMDLENATINGSLFVKSRNNRTLINGNIFMAFIFVAKRAVFSDLDIKKDVKIESAKKIGNLSFLSTNIYGNLKIYDSSKIKEVKFGGENAFIEGNFLLENSKIQSKITFESIEIHGNIDFDTVTIDGKANFKNLEVKKGLSFVNVTFGSDLNFRYAKIGTGNYKPLKRIALFQQAEITGNADFIRAEFRSKAIFVPVHFKNNVFFNYTKFYGFTNFNGAKFFEDADFNKTTFRNKVDFSRVSFLTVGLFSEINNNSIFLASFENARLKNVAFRDCNLTYIRFKNSILENCELSTSDWDDKILEHRDYEKKKGLRRFIKFMKITTFRGNPEGYNDCLGRYYKFTRGLLKEAWSPSQFKNAEIASDTYRRIKQCLQNEGSYNKAGKFYIHEMDLKRDIYWSKNKKSWFIYKLLSVTSNYGESYILPVVWFVGVIVFFTVIYFVFGFLDINHPADVKLSTFDQILGSFCYSALTSVTLSYNYVQPKDGWPVFLSIIEAGISTFLIALFVFVFARRMSR